MYQLKDPAIQTFKKLNQISGLWNMENLKKNSILHPR